MSYINYLCLSIEELHLQGLALQAALMLKERFQNIIFTSGKRTKSDQCRAMASNIISSGNRQWISDTYAVSTISTALQHWINENSQVVDIEGITNGLLSIMNTFDDTEVSRISKHLTGEAFDIQPVTQDAEEIKEFVRNLPGLTKFLEREGGLVRWHAQF